MVKNDHSWFQEDTSWPKTTRHGKGVKHQMSELRKQGIRQASDNFYKIRGGENFDFSGGF